MWRFFPVFNKCIQVFAMLARYFFGPFLWSNNFQRMIAVQVSLLRKKMGDD